MSCYFICARRNNNFMDISKMVGRVRAGQGKSWKTGISGKTLMVTGKSGIVRKIDKSQGKFRK